jgi:hypothetical protein
MNEFLAQRLEQLYRSFDINHLDPDPLVVVRRYDDPADLEVAGLIAAALAYGGVRTIMRDVEDFPGRMGDSPADFARHFRRERDARVFDGWKHRLHGPKDAIALVSGIGKALREYGSLGGLFAVGWREHEDIGLATHGIRAPLTRMVASGWSTLQPPLEQSGRWVHLQTHESLPALDGSAHIARLWSVDSHLTFPVDHSRRHSRRSDIPICRTHVS